MVSKGQDVPATREKPHHLLIERTKAFVELRFPPLIENLKKYKDQ